MQPESYVIESNEDFSIDAEFKNLLPALDDDARRELELSVIRDGCIDPLVVWDEERLLLDGHHRYDICVAHSIPFKIKVISLKTRLHANIWILQHNAARRHLPDSMRAFYAAQLARLLMEETKQIKLDNLALGSKDRAPDCHIYDNRGDVENKGLRTTDKVGKMFGVSRQQVEDAATVISTGIPDLVKELASMPIHRAARIARLPKDRQERVMAAEDKQRALIDESRSIIVREVEEVYILRRFLKNWDVTVDMMGVHNRQLLIRGIVWLMKHGNELMQTTAAAYMAVAMGAPYSKDGINDTHEEILAKWDKAVREAAEDIKPIGR